MPLYDRRSPSLSGTFCPPCAAGAGACAHVVEAVSTHANIRQIMAFIHAPWKFRGRNHYNGGLPWRATMIPVPAVSRRELFRRLGLAGAAALVLPGLDRVLAFQRDVKGRSDTGRRVERERGRHAGGDLRAAHPDRRERARCCRGACVRVHRSGADRLAGTVPRGILGWSGRR